MTPNPAPPPSRWPTVLAWIQWAVHRLDALQPAAALMARAYVAEVFFRSGLTKIQDWETTQLLFESEYQVPLLSPAVAAVMGTAGELVLPVLLLLGLAGRFSALGLAVVNVVAVVALPDMPAAAFQAHVTWGLLLAGVALYGPGAWSVDARLQQRCWGASR